MPSLNGMARVIYAALAVICTWAANKLLGGSERMKELARFFNERARG